MAFRRRVVVCFAVRMDTLLARTGRRVSAPLLGVLTLLGISGCLLGDPPPDPAEAPIEVVVGSRTVEEECLLNRESVAAGTHEVTVIGDSGPATVRILDEAGDVVFEGAAITDGQGPPEGSPLAELASGQHLVECTPEGGPTTTVPLQVAP